MPVKLVSAALTCLIRDVVNQLLTCASGTRRRVHKQVMEVKVGVNARSRRVRVVGCEANGLAVGSIGGYRCADRILRVEETIKGDIGYIVGDGALVKSVVLSPEVLPCLFIGSLDGADLDG